MIAPTLLADLFPVKDRGRAMGVYYLGLPVGTALGYMLGGTITDALGWRAVFLSSGFPGSLAAFAGLLVNDPGRGASEGELPRARRRPGRASRISGALPDTDVLYNTAGMAAVTFATGAYGAWGLIFYQRAFTG